MKTLRQNPNKSEKKMYVDHSTMGNWNSLSLQGRGQPFSSIEKKASPEGGTWKQIDICLLCQKNSDKFAINKSIDVVKNAISYFLTQLYDTDDATTFNFRTWDQDDADITMKALRAGVESTNTGSSFDVMVELHCELTCGSNNSGRPTGDDYRLMCRLLHTHGILVMPRDLDSVNVIMRENHDYVSRDARMIPIFSVVPDKGAVYDLALQSLNKGVTVFQKVPRR